MTALESLVEYPVDTLVVQLPRSPGRKDSEYMHLLSGEVDIEAHAQQVATAQPERATSRSSLTQLEQRLDELEAEVAQLKQRLE